MMSKRVMAAGAAVVVMMVLSACQPAQLEIDFTLRRSGTVSTVSEVNGTKTEAVTLTGVVACSAGSNANAEVITLFLNWPGPGTVVLEEGDIECRLDPYIWTETWEIRVPTSVDLTATPIVVDILACTNPGELIDEDCSSDQETVALKRIR